MNNFDTVNKQLIKPEIAAHYYFSIKQAKKKKTTNFCGVIIIALQKHCLGYMVQTQIKHRQ